MDAFRKLAVVVVGLLLYQGFLSVHALSVSESIQMNLRHFSRTRNNYKDPAFVQTTRDFISLAFKGAGLETWTETFTSNDPQFPGINIIGQLPGRYTGTRDDKIVLIGAHYDSVQTTPGVDDNGSGMTALLQALSLFVNSDKQNCLRDYTLMFVAFDLEEPQPFGPGCTNQSDYTTCPCGKGDYPINYDCGSYYFVQNFSRRLNSSGAQLSGAFILDCVMNFNNSANSQDLPPGTSFLFPNLTVKVSSNQNRGDFITLIGRQANDGNLMTTIDKNFYNTDKFKLIAVGLPFSGRPSDALPTQNLRRISSFFESDHFRFWQSKPSLNAIHITDSSYYRGHMIQCYHDSCDDLAHVTDDMITFLGKTVDSLVKSAEELTHEQCEVKNKICGGEVTAEAGSIHSPYFPAKYPNNVFCEWTIKTPRDDMAINLSFEKFQLEGGSDDCSRDYLEVLNNGQKRFCGSDLPQDIKSRGSTVTIIFRSDQLQAFSGFKVSWSTVPVPTAAGCTVPVPTAAGPRHCLDGVVMLIGVFLITWLSFSRQFV